MDTQHPETGEIMVELSEMLRDGFSNEAVYQILNKQVTRQVIREVRATLVAQGAQFLSGRKQRTSKRHLDSISDTIIDDYYTTTTDGQRWLYSIRMVAKRHNIVFMTIYNLLRARDMPTRSRLTPARREALIMALEMYYEGHSLNSIYALTTFPPPSVYQIMRLADLPLRARMPADFDYKAHIRAKIA